MSVQEAPLKRKKNAARTSAEILRAAALAFSHQGYAQAGIREIAAAVGVNAALVMRYYGSKENLFSAALAQALNYDVLVEGSRADFGQRVTQILCGDDRTQLNPTSMMILATADPAATRITEKLLDSHIIQPVARWLGPPHAEVRASLITILCTGFVIYRKLLPTEALAGPTPFMGADWLAHTLQSLVDGDGFGEDVFSG